MSLIRKQKIVTKLKVRNERWKKEMFFCTEETLGFDNEIRK